MNFVDWLTYRESLELQKRRDRALAEAEELELRRREVKALERLAARK